MNRAEQVVFSICRRSFLSLWAYINPRQKPNGKELCDVLVICEPDIVIFSVKEIRLSKSGKPEVDAKRWRRRAVEQSCAQIYGAERVIAASPHVIRHDNSEGLVFPKPPEARIHRVAVALGSEGKVSLPLYGDFGKGVISVFDEASFMILLNELDTVTDFVYYLREKERFLSGKHAIFEGAEEDLLALYLHGGRKLPENYELVIFGDNLWRTLQAKDEFQRKKEADKESYAWDRLIEIWCRDVLNNNLEFAPSPSNTERAIRTMAREGRFARRILGAGYKEFLDNSKRIRSRMMQSPSGVVYVFLAHAHDTPRDYRVADLGNRCFVARGLNPDSKMVVGIATEQYEAGKGFSLDLIHLYMPAWTETDQANMEAMQLDLGYFVGPDKSVEREDEYPES